MSPGFYKSYWTEEETVGLKHDSADGFVSDFALNLQTMQYLYAVNSLKYEELGETFDYMRSG